MTLFAPDAAGLAACVAQLEKGNAIGLPTETVYGLAADASSGAAIARIYELKDRPSFNPLICHVADAAMAERLGVFNATAKKLATAFWPGPLTLVVPRAPDCPVDPLASAGLDTIALRVPAHPVAQQLLAAFDGPLVAPSANPSGRLSPSTAAHVAALLPEVDVLDGGDCAVGVESSIIGCLDETPLWLRAGGLARDDIEAVLGQKLTELPEEKDATAKLAPGRLARHYAPNTPLRLNADAARDGEWLIGFGAGAPADCKFNLSPKGDMSEAAANLFSILHQADAQAEAVGKTLAIMPIPQEGLGEALNDRLKRAANH